MTLLYLDASALVKLVMDESHTAALTAFVAQENRQPGLTLASSALSRAEVTRAVSRTSPQAIDHALKVLEGVHLVEVTRKVIERAGLLTPPHLRTLDAIHLATAMAEGAGLKAFVTYDIRMAQAATELGLPVTSPGMTVAR